MYASAANSRLGVPCSFQSNCHARVELGYGELARAVQRVISVQKPQDLVEAVCCFSGRTLTG